MVEGYKEALLIPLPTTQLLPNPWEVAPAPEAHLVGGLFPPSSPSLHQDGEGIRQGGPAVRVAFQHSMGRRIVGAAFPSL